MKCQVQAVTWTKRSRESTEPLGYIRILVPKTKAHKFPLRLQLFGIAVGILRIRDRQPVSTQEKCHGLHSTHTCACQTLCKIYYTKKHEGPCAQPRRYLNYRGHHESISISYPARPCRKNGTLVRPTSAYLKHIRVARRKNFNKAQNIESIQERKSEWSPVLTGAFDSSTIAY